MYAGPITDTHMHLWDLPNNYDWLSKNDPGMEHIIAFADLTAPDFEETLH